MSGPFRTFARAWVSFNQVSPAIRPKTREKLAFSDLRPVESGFTAGSRHEHSGKTFAFPHFFPQLWKTSGGDPTVRAGDATVTQALDVRQPARRRPPIIDRLRGAWLLSKFLRRSSFAPKGSEHERYFPAKPPAPQTHARIPRAHGNQEWPTGSETAARQGAQASHGFLLIGRARSPAPRRTIPWRPSASPRPAGSGVAANSSAFLICRSGRRDATSRYWSHPMRRERHDSGSWPRASSAMQCAEIKLNG